MKNREFIFKKAQKINREQKEWAFHRKICLSAGICPNCGKDFELKGYSFYDSFLDCECGYYYSKYKEKGRTI